MSWHSRHGFGSQRSGSSLVPKLHGGDLARASGSIDMCMFMVMQNLHTLVCSKINAVLEPEQIKTAQTDVGQTCNV